MSTYNPKITISSAPGVVGYLYLVAYEATSPNTPVANSGQLAPPHNASRQLQFTGLNPVVHLWKLFETDGSSPTGVLRANFSTDPQYPGVEVRLTEYLIAGTTPGFASGDNKYVDPDDSLEGWDYDLFITGYGFINPDNISYDANNNPAIINPGTGNPTMPGEEWVLIFKSKEITFNPSANNGGNLIGDVIIIDVDTNLDDTYMGSQIIAQGANSTLVLELPDLETVVVNKLLMIAAEGGSNVNTVINSFGGTDPIDFLGTAVFQIILGRGEEISFYKWVDPNDSNNIRWKVKNPSPGIKMVGEKVYHDLKDDADIAELNLIFADGRDDLDKAVYARLWDYVSNKLPGSMLVSQATWNTESPAASGIFPNQAKFYEVDGNTFGLPKLYNQGFLRGVDGTVRLAGTREDLQLLDHTHKVNLYDGVGATPNLVQAYGVLTGTQDLSGSPVKADGTTLGARVGTENRPSNDGVYILIRI